MHFLDLLIFLLYLAGMLGVGIFFMRRNKSTDDYFAGSLTKSLLKPGGARLSERMKGLKTVLSAVTTNLRDSKGLSSRDPIHLTRKDLLTDIQRLEQLEIAVKNEVSQYLEIALTDVV